MVSGLAMRCRLELSQLARRYGAITPNPVTLPLTPPSDRPTIITGIACSNSIDQERTRFRPYALSFLPWQPPPLLYRHREPAGEILKLEYDAKGRLIIEARVDHPEARRCQALSIAATVNDFELREADDPKNFHAVILQASLDEVSLTPNPCCQDCLVTSRLQVSPHGETMDLAKRGIEKIQEMVRLLQKMHAHDVKGVRSTTKTPTKPPKNASEFPTQFQPRPVAREPHRATPFGALVRAIEQRAEG